MDEKTPQNAALNEEYWLRQLQAERQRASDNLRLAAERAAEIDALRRRVKELEELVMVSTEAELEKEENYNSSEGAREGK